MAILYEEKKRGGGSLRMAASAAIVHPTSRRRPAPPLSERLPADRPQSQTLVVIKEILQPSRHRMETVEQTRATVNSAHTLISYIDDVVGWCMFNVYATRVMFYGSCSQIRVL